MQRYLQMHSFDKACFDRDGGQTHILHLCDCICICIIHIMKEEWDCTCTCVYAQLIRCNIWQIMFSQIWRPDTFFINGRDSYQHKVRHPFPKITSHISLSLMSQMSCIFHSVKKIYCLTLFCIKIYQRVKTLLLWNYWVYDFPKLCIKYPNSFWSTGQVIITIVIIITITDTIIWHNHH